MEQNNFIQQRIESSMKYQDLTGLKEEEIIEKYEDLLFEREKQIKDLSYQIGLLNEKYFDCLDKYKLTESENIKIEEKRIKKEKLLQNEKENTNIMKKRIELLTSQNSYYKNKIKENCEKESMKEGHLNKLLRNTEEEKRRNRSVNISNAPDNRLKVIDGLKGKKKKKNGSSNLLSESVKYEPLFK